MTSSAGGVRARARAEMTEQIKSAARERLATEGANLSLRAVARDLGVVSSAVYRYFASRDDLLTALIVDAYDGLGDAVDTAVDARREGDLTGRWSALCHAVRGWALENQHEYALLYGSPVPGYVAPQATIGPASRPLLRAVAILRDGAERGVLVAPSDRLPKAVRADLTTLTVLPEYAGVATGLLVRGMSVWALLFGTVSFELFGRFTGGVHDWDAYFGHQVGVMRAHLGLP